MDKKNCIGCRDNFYNGNNGLGVKECWNFEDARMMLRKKVGVWDRPPWTWKPKLFPSCYSADGFAMINCDKEDRQY